MADEPDNTEEPETPETAEALDQAAADEPTAQAEAPETAAAEPDAVEEPDSEPEAVEEPDADAGSAAPEAADEPAEPEPVDDRPAHVIRKAAKRAKRGLRRPSTPEERAAQRKQKAAARSRQRKNARERAAAKRKESPAQPTPPAERAPGALKVRQGTVVSDRADKTITVRIDTARRHKRYEKIVRSSSTLHAHDEANDAHIGDTVRVEECRPMSRTKRWKLVEVLERAK